MRQFFAVFCVLLSLLDVCSASAQQPTPPLLINGWNRFPATADVVWWENNAKHYDDLGYDCVLHVLETVNFDLMDRVIAEDQKRNYQLIVTIDGVRNIVDVLTFFERYGDRKNAAGEKLIHSAVIGWDRVNNLHPDEPIESLYAEMKAASELARVVDAELPVWICVSYSPGEALNEWYAKMKDIERTGIWLWDVWGWGADLEKPLQWLKDHGETRVILGGVYGWKYFALPEREDLIARSATTLPGYWQRVGELGFTGAAFLTNFDASGQFGSSRLFDARGQPNALYDAFSKLK